MPIDPEDLNLVAAVNRGEADAFEILYLRHRDWVFRLAWRFTGCEQDAQDVLQETFIYLFRKFPGFALTAALTTFLYPVVKHLALTARQKRRRLMSQEDLPESVPADPDIDNRAARGELAEALARLPDDRREVLLMRFVDGLTLDQIAQALQLPAGTVKSRLYRALHALKDDPQARKYFQE
ncbi:MAG: RNA polymerase sigma factor [Sedimentisphaerales bacterium]|nr:RNA polymerase sigma factor [Sedimentisphaerales bacterium]